MTAQTKQTRYESMKNAARKYLGIGILTGALAFSGCSNQVDPAYEALQKKVCNTNATYALPVQENTRAEMEVSKNAELEKMKAEAERKAKEARYELSQMSKEFSNALGIARYTFNQSLRDGEFSVSEQRQVLKNYNEIAGISAKIAEKARENGFTNYTGVAMGEADSNLYTAVQENISHYNREAAAGLEKSLAAQGTPVKVEANKKSAPFPFVAFSPFWIYLLTRRRN